jgi:hypothetical protein
MPDCPYLLLVRNAETDALSRLKTAERDHAESTGQRRREDGRRVDAARQAHVALAELRRALESAPHPPVEAPARE